ncbi:hypothetical protein [Bacillus toyonensis]|uniref:hypothetical protein n=1 Tax=Bacillus toyonensis TaxID=155322 RepID=UPI000BF92E09|nr:hypothetical protein [Bacillus toyonensis]PGF05180.1 hypothetical protein COM61_01795 [Bacillus toyonensis]
MQTVLFITLTVISILVTVLNMYSTRTVLTKASKEEGIDAEKEKGSAVVLVTLLLIMCVGTSFIAGSVETSIKLLTYYILISLIMSAVPVVFIKLRKKHETLSSLVPVFSILVLFYPVSELLDIMFTVWKEVTDIPYPYINFISWWWR